MDREAILKYLNEIANFEETHDMSKFKIGWCHREVRIQGVILSNLYMAGYLDNVFRSNSRTGYRLNEKGRQAIAANQPVLETPASSRQSELTIPDDLFDTIEGYEDVKRLTLKALTCEKPVHLLYTGVPGSAKTMFLLELSRLGASYILGSQSTKSGVADLLFDFEPAILLVDEIDRIGNKDISVLLSLTATGIVSETKHGNTREITLQTRVFATSNTIRMAPELLSRFMILQFKPYARDNFLMVATNVLRKREGVDAALAAYIAERIWALPARFADPRQAIRVARLSKTKEEVDQVIEFMKNQSN
jgi:Holliday junction DNA helicase RuvB